MWQVNHSESFNRVVLVQHNNLNFELQVRIDLNVALDAADIVAASSAAGAGATLPLLKVNCATSSASAIAVKVVTGAVPNTLSNGAAMAKVAPQVRVIPTSTADVPVVPAVSPVPQKVPVSASAVVGSSGIKSVAKTVSQRVPQSGGESSDVKGMTAFVPLSAAATKPIPASGSSVVPVPPVAGGSQGMMLYNRSSDSSFSAAAVGSESIKYVHPALSTFVTDTATSLAPVASAVSSAAAQNIAPTYTGSAEPLVSNPRRPADLQEVVDAIYSLDQGRYAHLFADPRVDILATASMFFNYYEFKGWRVGQTPMSNWLCALRRAIAPGYTVDRKRRGWAITYYSFSSVCASALWANS